MIFPYSDVAGYAFFSIMRTYMRDQIHDFVSDGLSRMLTLTGIAATPMLTIWIMFKGYRIMTGQSKEPLTEFLVQSCKMIFIVSAALTSNYYKPWVQDNIDDVRQLITYTITGSNKDVYAQVDKNIAIAQGIMVTISSISQNMQDAPVGGWSDKEINTASWLGVIGGASPAVVAGMVSLLNEFMLSLAIVLGPLFLLALLFEQTKQLFWNWVRYVVGIMFSMAVLAFMSAIVMKISIGYAGAVAAALAIQHTGIGTALGIDGPNIMKTCMMQGGLGMVLSLLLITIPPMVMQFFSVSLGGGVSGYSPFSGAVPSGGGIAESQGGGEGGAGGGVSASNDASKRNNGGFGQGSAIGSTIGGREVMSLSAYNQLSPGDRRASNALVQTSGGNLIDPNSYGSMARMNQQARMLDQDSGIQSQRRAVAQQILDKV